jgi:predicted dehydrogenase
MRFGIVGAGVIGQLRAQSIKEHPSTELVAVFDPAAGAAAKAVAGSRARAVPTLEDFMKVEMDAIIVSSPPHLHEEACLGALERGRHVLCEKPLTNAPDSARRILEAAEEAGLALGVGFNLRYYPCIEFVKNAIDAGMIGDIDHLRVFGGHEGLPKFRIDWQYKAPESGGGAMWDVGIHMTDVAQYLMGGVTQVYGIMTDNVWQVPGSEDNAIAIFRNAEGLTASYHATWNEWKGYRFYVEVYGTHGMVRGSYAPMQNVIITQDRPGGPRKTRRHYYPEIMVREKLFSWHTTALRSFHGELRDFLAMTEGKDHGRLADGYDGVNAIAIAAAVRESTATGEVVHLTPRPVHV